MSFILGEPPPLEAVQAALNRSDTYPAGCADDLPVLLQAEGWLKFEHGFALYAEVAYIRWLDVAKAFGSPKTAHRLVEALRNAGCSRIAFREDRKVYAFLVETLGDFAFRLAAELAGRIYALPRCPWDAARAAAIQFDVEAEVCQVASCSGAAEGLRPCADRLWQRDEIDRQAERQVPALRK